ncbi:MAG: hypothetical protein ABWY34_02450 [Pseudoxanthomonas sp.]
METPTFEWLDAVPESEWSEVRNDWRHLKLDQAEFLNRCCVAGADGLVDEFKRWAAKHRGHDYALAWDLPGSPDALFVIAKREAPPLGRLADIGRRNRPVLSR